MATEPEDRVAISTTPIDSSPSLPSRYHTHATIFEERPLPMRRVVEGMLRCRLMIVVTIVVFTIGAAVFAILQPNVYRSTGAFLFRRGSEHLPVSLAPQQQGGLNPVEAAAPFILRSEELARRTVKRIGAAKVLAPFRPQLDEEAAAGTFGTIRSWIYELQRRLHERDPAEASAPDALQAFSERLTVVVPRGNPNCVTVGFSSFDPAAAREVLAAYMEEAIKLHLDLYSDEASIALIEQRFEDVRKENDRARREYSAFLTDHAVEDFEADLDELRGELRTVRANATSLREAVNTAVRRRTRLEKLLGGLPDEVKREEVVEERNPQIDALEAEERRLTRELAIVRARFVDENDAAVRATRTQLEGVQKNLAEERKRPIIRRPRTIIGSNPQQGTLRAQITALTAQLEADQETLATIEERLAALRQQVDSLTGKQPEHRRLLAARDSAQADFDVAERSLSLARNKTLLNTNQVSSLKTLNPASEPLTRESPKRSRIVFGGILIGLFFGLGLALLRTILDGTVRSVDDLEDAGAIPVLAAIPVLTRKNVSRHLCRLPR